MKYDGIRFVKIQDKSNKYLLYLPSPESFNASKCKSHAIGPLCSVRTLDMKRPTIINFTKDITIRFIDEPKVLHKSKHLLYIIFPKFGIWSLMNEIAYHLIRELNNPIAISYLVEITNDKQTTFELVELLNSLGLVAESSEAIKMSIEEPFTKKRLVEDEYNRSLQLSITDNCNHLCKYCMVSATSDSKAFIDLSILENKYLLRNEKIKKSFVTIQGGEPLLHPEFKAVIKSLNRQNVYANVYTNGWLLTDELIDYIYENSGNIVLSLDGNENIHDYLRKTGSFRKVLNSIRYIAQNNYKTIGVSFCVTTYNINQMKFIYDLCSDYKIDFLFLYKVHEIGRAKNNNIGKVSLFQVVKAQSEIEKSNQYNIEIDNDYRSWKYIVSNMVTSNHCGFGIKNKIFIDSHGISHNCHMASINYPLFKKKIKLTNTIGEIPVECQACEVRYYCLGGCPIEHEFAARIDFCDDIKRVIVFLMNECLSDQFENMY